MPKLLSLFIAILFALADYVEAHKEKENNDRPVKVASSIYIRLFGG